MTPDERPDGAPAAPVLGVSGRYSLAELAAAVGTDEATVRSYWLALGLPVVEGSERIFTDDDADTLADLLRFAATEGLDERTVTTLVRSTGHTMERLVLWQAEALVGNLVEHQGVDPVTARLRLVEELPRIAPLLETQLRHAWRRHLATYATRYELEFRAMQAQGAQGAAGDHLELARAVGFADIVNFTKRTAGYDSIELAHFVQDFEAGARDRIAAAGGRVVKTIGDAVLFVADTAATGAEVALRLAESPQEDSNRGVPVRVSLVWGRVLSRFGDVFGPSVNLAARLVDIAEPGTVLMDRETAALLAAEPALALTGEAAREVQGLGTVEPVRLQRAYRA